MSKLKILILLILFLTFVIGKTEANIVLKAVIVNPSKTEKRIIPFKAYLPQEVKPEDIIDKAELEIAYDTQRSCYYLFKDYELNPGESIMQEIEIKDVWKISQEEIESLGSEAAKLLKLLDNTEFFERANFLKNSIESKLNEIILRQGKSQATPDGYISDYRYNLQLIEAVKLDLQAVRNLLTQTRPISPYAAWRLILGIVLFLGILGLGYFIVWQRQIKLMPRLTSEPKPIGSEEAGVVEQRKVKKEKKVGIEDIEKRLKEV